MNLLVPTPRRRTFTAAGIALLLPLMMAGCSDEIEESTSQPSPSSDQATVGSCLREAGYDVDDSSLVPGVMAVPAGADVAQYGRDYTTCTEGTSFESSTESLSGDEMAAQQTVLLDYVGCLREQGLEDVPDPVDGWIDMPEEYMSTAADNPLFAADEVCSELLDESRVQ